MLLYTTITLEVAHRLETASDTMALHGHSYWVQVFVASNAANPYPLPQLEAHAQGIKQKLDHQCLNDFIAQPTQEALVDYIRQLWPPTAPALQKIIVRRDSIGTGVEWQAASVSSAAAS